MKFRDVLNKIAFKFLSFRNENGRQFYLSIFIVILIVIVILSLLTIRQFRDTKVKENILKTVLNSNKNSGTEENAKSTLAGDPDVKTQKEVIKIKVYICGKIKNAGVYELNENTRIVDLISIAGGVKEDAYLDSLNLAEILTDGQKVYIPSKEEVSDSVGSNLAGNNMAGDSKTKIININFATRGDLELLPGIGPELAQRIIDYRNTSGPFKKKEDLKNVTGIGDKKFDALKDFISV